MRSSNFTEYRSTTVSLMVISHGFSAGIFPLGFVPAPFAPVGSADCPSSGTKAGDVRFPAGGASHGNRSFRRCDPADRDLFLDRVDLGLFHIEPGDYEELLLLLPLTQPKIRYGRSQAGEPEFRPAIPLGKTVAGSHVEGPAVDIEPHRVAEVRRILLQGHLREGDRSFRRRGGKGTGFPSVRTSLPLRSKRTPGRRPSSPARCQDRLRRPGYLPTRS